MIRTFQINPDHVKFVAYMPHKNHSAEHLHPVNKGSFGAYNVVIKWIVGIAWKYFGIGGRQ